jgi:D-psicose/D-tagatose/L-ribulose 3-epimerase
VKLAISNIAWPTDQDAHVADLLKHLGVTGIEIAPTKIWPAPLETTPAEIARYRQFWADRGIAVVAAQALLFGQPQLTLFENSEKRGRMLAYLTVMARVCADLAIGALVFGSPKNRCVAGLPRETTWPIAVDFFGKLGEAAAAAGTTIVMEANPPEYGTDFVTHAAEAIEMVQAVNHPGFRLHLDSACMTLANDPISETIAAGAPLLRHFHVSEPFLAPVQPGGVAHHLFARELNRVGYSHWLSIEMRQQEPFAPQRLSDTITFVRAAYGV